MVAPLKVHFLKGLLKRSVFEAENFNDLIPWKKIWEMYLEKAYAFKALLWNLNRESEIATTVCIWKRVERGSSEQSLKVVWRIKGVEEELKE